MIRAVVADDSALFRHGTAMVMSSGGIEVVGTAANTDELFSLVDKHRPDIAIVDIRMPPTLSTEGIDAAITIRRRHPRTAVMLLSAHVLVRHLTRLLDQSPTAVGYLLKDRVSEIGAFLAEVRTVAEGRTVVDPELVDALVRCRSAKGPGLDGLTRREMEVLELMAQGKSNAAIADELTLSARTVEGNTNSIFTKLGLAADTSVNRRVSAVVEFLRA